MQVTPKQVDLLAALSVQMNDEFRQKLGIHAMCEHRLLLTPITLMMLAIDIECERTPSAVRGDALRLLVEHANEYAHEVAKGKAR